MSKREVLIVNCSCSHLHHMVRFTFWPWGPNDKGPFEAYIEVSLDRMQSVWGRIKTAVRFVFGRTCGYGDVAEIILNDEDLPKLREWLERAESDAVVRKLGDNR